MDKKLLVALLGELIKDESAKPDEPRDLGPIEARVGSFRRIEKANGGSYESFNAYVGVRGAGLGVLLAGLRLMEGKICPPARFNVGSKKFFNTAYTSRGAAEAIWNALRASGRDLAPIDEATRSLLYTDEKIRNWLT